MSTKKYQLHGLRAFHLFAGAGGGILADQLLGHTTIGAVEIDEYNQQVLQSRMRDGILPRFPIFEDVREFEPKPWKGKIDILCGGFPCQDISVAGKGEGITGNRSSLWFRMAEIIRDTAPPFVFAENVAALMRKGFEYVLSDLSALGYDVWWCTMGGDSLKGSPILRARVWIFARAHGVGQYPLEGNGKNYTEDSSQGAADTPLLSVRIPGGREKVFPDPLRMGDGVSPELDTKHISRRLYGCGNAQVPALAAKAQVHLWHLACTC